MYLYSKSKKMFEKKELIISTMQRIASPAISEILALVGSDLITLDNEHYPFTDKQLINCIRAAQGKGADCIVRVTNNDLATISRVMDMGANGVLVPHVDSYEQALNVVDAIKYAPVGKRGFCPITRSAYYGYGLTLQEYVKISNENSIVGIMVETKDGIEDLDRILTIKEIDFIAVGPSDVSASFGYPGDLDHPEVKQALKTAREKICAAGFGLSGQAYTKQKGEELISQGATRMNVGSDLQTLVKSFGTKVTEYKKAFNI